MNWDRVFAVTGAGGAGSGYLVAPDLVLTSGHVVAGAEAVTVFRPGRPGRFTGTVVWRGREDAALVRTERMPVGGDVVWGRTVTHRPRLDCTCWAVPELVQRADRPVDVAQLSGHLNPGDRMVGDRYVMHLDGRAPAGESPWGGASGAALFCGDLLTGVIAVDPAGRRHGALEAVPAYVLLRDPEFHTLVGAPPCVGVETRALDDPHARPGTVASPASLLAARNAVVPFHGRDEQLDELHAWAARPGVGVWLLHGPGGQGKTRLAQQFGAQLAGWEVVWPRPTAEDLTVLGEATVPVLAIVDYAEGRTDQLAALLGELARDHRRPLKILLLARTAGEWWQHLAAENDTLRDLPDIAVVSRLPTVSGNLYRSAVTAFAAALPQVPGMAGTDWPAAATRLGDAPRQDGTILAVHMTALADLLDTASTVDGGGPEDRLLDHERRHWKSTARTHGLLPGLSMATLTDTIAAVTLLGPPKTRAVDEFLTRVPGLADQPRDRRDTVRAWLADLYPATGQDIAFDTLQPDRLAERLIGRLILDRGRVSIAEALAPHVTYEEATTLLTVCTRAAAHATLGDGVAEALIRWCVANPDTLAMPAIDVAAQMESPGPLVTAVERLVESADFEQLRRLGNALPALTEVFADTALTVARALIPRYRTAAEKNPDALDGLGFGLLLLSDRLSAAGEREEALAAITEGVEILRRLAERRHDATRYLPGGLRRLANRLSDVGQPQEALAAITEATDLVRILAAQAPEEYEFEIANNLNILSSCLANLHRYDESMVPLTEAARIVGRLAGIAPEHYRFPHAEILHNIANRLLMMGRAEEALTPITKSVAIRRSLVAQNADAHLPSLAKGMNTFAITLGNLGRREDELAAITEAVRLFRDLTAARPGPHRDALAGALLNLARCLHALRRHEEAVDAITESVAIRRSLAEELPGAYRAGLATSLHELAHHLVGAGSTEEALPAIVESMRTRSELAKAQPMAHVHDLAASVQSYAQWCIDLGRYEYAVSAIDQLVDIRRQIAEVENDHARQDPLIATALEVRADLQRHLADRSL